MATRVIDDSKLNNIATAIQAKDGGGQMTVDEMPNRIEALPTVLIPKTITENGVYNASSDNADGYDVVTVNIQPYFSKDGTMYFEEMSIPDTVTKVKASAYTACVNMRKLEIAGSVKNINPYAFQNTNITDLILNEGIETIGSSAFANHECQIIVLPSSTKTISGYAFASSKVNNQIVDLSAFIDPNNLPTLDASNAFNNIKVLRYEVANQLMLDAFAAATNWSTYSGKYVIKEAN